MYIFVYVNVCYDPRVYPGVRVCPAKSVTELNARPWSAVGEMSSMYVAAAMNVPRSVQTEPDRTK